MDESLSAFHFTTGELKLKSSKPSSGAGSAEMSISYNGPDVRVGLNPRFIRDGLEAMTAKRCRFMFQGPRNAGVMKELLSSSDGSESVSDRFVYAVLPIVLQKDDPQNQ